MTKGTLVLLGSGETAPGMTKIHRGLFSKLDTVRGVNLDSAYGFQENVPEMTEKLLEYFSVSLNTALTPLSLTSFDKASSLERTLFSSQVAKANYIFAGPGSPSYALSQWSRVGLGATLTGVLQSGGTVCFSSAAALTLGAFTAPIYEIYKVGVTPYWLEGLNVLGQFGLNCAVIPHFDNSEGRTYDTGCCYIGMRRLTLMEQELPQGVATLGIDEHTALIFDFEADTVEVKGKSNGYWRLGGTMRILENGSITALNELRTAKALSVSAPLEVPQNDHLGPVELGNVIARGGSGAISALAELVQLASTGGTGFIDPTPLVVEVLNARVEARNLKQYKLADQLRDALIRAGIDVQDGPDGATWSLRK